MQPGDPTRLISHETIHAAICAQPRGGLKAGMIAALRQHKPARGCGARRWQVALSTRNRCGSSPALRKSRPVWCPVSGKAIRSRGRQPLGGGQVVERKTRYLVLSSSSVKQSIRGIDWCAERAAAPPDEPATPQDPRMENPR